MSWPSTMRGRAKTMLSSRTWSRKPTTLAACRGGGAKEEVADNDDAAGTYSYHSGTTDGEETSASDGDFPTHDAEAEAEERAANAARQLAQ